MQKCEDENDITLDDFTMQKTSFRDAPSTCYFYHYTQISFSWKTKNFSWQGKRNNKESP